jgi:DNA replication protein DnaC
MTITNLSKTCPGCGLEMLVPMPDGPFAIKLDTDMQVHCDTCAAKNLRAHRREQLAIRLRERFSVLRNRDLVTTEFREASFRNSTPDIEAMNPESWGLGRAWRGVQNLYIYGPTGVGKSYLARCCLKRIFQANRNVAETSARAFCKTTDTFTEGRGRFMEWKTVPALLLDDIDKTTWNADRVGALWELLDARSSGRRVTIITGNVSPKDLRDMLQEACVSGKSANSTCADAALERLRPCLTLHLTGASQRRIDHNRTA